MNAAEEEQFMDNMQEVEVSGIFIKHDFDHIILNSDEIEKYTAGDLSISTMKQSLVVPYQYDIQVLLYVLYAHFPEVTTQLGKDEVQATAIDNHLHPAGNQEGKKKYDLKIVIGTKAITLKYYY